MSKMQALSRWLLLATISLLLSSCASTLQEKISFEALQSVELLGLSGVRANVVLRNESCHKVKVKGVDIVLKKGDRRVAKLTLKDEVVIPRRCSTELVPTIWRISEADPIALLSASRKLLRGDIQDFNLDIDAVGKVSIVRKRVEYHDISIPTLVKKLK